MQEFFIWLFLCKPHHYISHRIHNVGLIVIDTDVASYVFAKCIGNNFSTAICLDYILVRFSD